MAHAEPQREEAPVTRDAPAPERPVTSSIDAVLRLQRTAGNSAVTSLLQRSPRTRRKPAAPSWDEALTVVSAISSIMLAAWEVKDGFAHRRSHPEDHPEVPATYRPLLDDWFLIVSRDGVQTAGGPKLSLDGRMRAQHLHRAAEQTAPLIEVLMKLGDAQTASWLEIAYWRPYQQSVTRAFDEAIEDDVQARVASAGALSLQAMTQEEALAQATSKALANIRLATTLVTRFTNGAAVDAAKELDALFKQAAANAAGPAGIQATKSMRLPAALMHLKSALDGVNAILALSDPERRRALMRSRPDLFGQVERGVDVIQLATQLVAGATSLVAAGTWAVATVRGNAALAARVLRFVVPKLDKLNFTLNVIGVVHGALVLLDDAATPDQKSGALLEVGISAAGVTGFLLRLAGVSGVSGPLTLSVAINFYAFEALAKATYGASAGILRLWMSACYEDMQHHAREIYRDAVRLAALLDLAREEKDANRREAFTQRAEGMREHLERRLQRYIARATREGASSVARNPSAYPVLRRRFAPLAGLETKSHAQTLDVAGRLVRIVVGCMTDAEQIFQRTVAEAWRR